MRLKPKTKKAISCEFCELKDHLDFDCMIYFKKKGCPHQKIRLENEQLRDKMQVMLFEKEIKKK